MGGLTNFLPDGGNPQSPHEKNPVAPWRHFGIDLVILLLLFTQPAEIWPWKNMMFQCMCSWQRKCIHVVFWFWFWYGSTPGADPGMGRFGPGPLLMTKSCKFSLFWGHSQFSLNFDTQPPLFANPGSGPATPQVGKNKLVLCACVCADICSYL